MEILKERIEERCVGFVNPVRVFFLCKLQPFANMLALTIVDRGILD